jgi:hypothetical protein
VRVIGVATALFGVAVLYFMGVRGDSWQQMTDALFAFFKVQKPTRVVAGA